MACLLYLYGDFDPELILRKVSWDANWWRKNELNLRGERQGQAGMKIVISERDLDEFDLQVSDAIEFLKVETESVKDLSTSQGVLGAVLDFGTAQESLYAYSRFLPAELVQLASECGLGVIIRLFACCPDEVVSP